MGEKKSYKEEIQSLRSQLEANEVELSSICKDDVLCKWAVEKTSSRVSSTEKDRDKVVKLNYDLQSRMNGFILELTELSMRNKDLKEEKEANSQRIS